MDRPSLQPPFVGESRFRLVDGLLAVLTEVETRCETRWVSLEAPSGWGKTRVAQELYARLAAHEADSDTGRYWPATILETVPEASLDQVGSRRKRVYPRWIDRGAAGLPSFFWWGIACDMRSDGTATEALLADLVEELIERLVRSNAAILIVTSTWPGEIEASERLAALGQDPIVGPRCLRLRHDQPLPEPFPAGASLDALPAEALAELVLAYYPGTAPEVVAYLAARYNNPLPLELVCNMAKLRRAFAGKSLGLTPAQIDALPDNDVHALYRAVWEDLPETAQQALALATLAIPEDTAAWHNRLTGEAIAACAELTGCEAIAETLDQDRVPHGWVRAVQEWLRRFNEPDQLRIAEEERASRFFDHEIEAVYQQIGEQIRTRGLKDTDPETQHRAWLALTLHRHGKGGIADIEALGAIRVLQRALADRPRELPARLALGDYLSRLALDRDSVDLLYARGDYALDCLTAPNACR